MLCPKWKPYRDAMPTAASQGLAFAIADFGSQLRHVKLPRKNPAQLQRGVEPCTLDQSSFKVGLFGPRGPRGNVYYLGMALEDLYGLAVEMKP